MKTYTLKIDLKALRDGADASMELARLLRVEAMLLETHGLYGMRAVSETCVVRPVYDGDKRAVGHVEIELSEET